MQSTKNAPRTPEEQAKALEEFLAAQESSVSPTLPKKDSSKKKKNSEKVKSGTPTPVTKRRKKTKSHLTTNNDPIVVVQPAVELKVAKTNKNRPLTPEEQQKAFEAYLASMEQEQSSVISSGSPDTPEIIVCKSSKNMPLSPEEQRIAMEKYIEESESKMEEELMTHESIPEKKETVIKVVKNSPLSPEEQQKAFEEYIAALGDDTLLEHMKTRGTLVRSSTVPIKPPPPTPNSSTLSMNQEGEHVSTVRVSKNRPLTREEQEIALKEFMARQAEEKKLEVQQQSLTKLNKAKRLTKVLTHKKPMVK